MRKRARRREPSAAVKLPILSHVYSAKILLDIGTLHLKHE
jgi:hypothetical protein